MKTMTPSFPLSGMHVCFIRAQLAKYEKGETGEREYLQNVLDLCIERIVDLDKARDDGCVTGSYNRNELAAVMVEAELLNSRPPSGTHSSGHEVIDLASDELDEDSSPPPPIVGSRALARLDANRDVLPLTELKKQIMVRDGETYGEETHQPISITLRDTKNGDSYSVIPKSSIPPPLTMACTDASGKLSRLPKL